jgi:hypothetical protein
MRDHCIDYPKLDHLYFTQYGNTSSDSKILTAPVVLSKRTPPKHAYLWSVQDDSTIDRNEYSIARKIDNHEFDVIIFADIHHSNPNIQLSLNSKIESQVFWNKVSKSYAKSRIGFLDGIDKHDRSHKDTMKVLENSLSFVCTFII